MVASGSNEEKGRRALDSTAGGLVWVQRRNGSWWPGQILGLDELPENGLSSPRSGTPIKLLGRDDLNVDWYDLETTKVIKAFRCGEYDACIEKAKVSAPKFLKRSLKYPRKEIAIIRALEIEETSVIKKASNLSDNPDNEALVNCENGSPSKPHSVKNSESSLEETTSACKEDLKPTKDLSRSGNSYVENNGSTCLKGKGKRRKTPNDSEDDGNTGFKRMKGLNDLGVGSPQRIQVLALANPVPPSNGSLNSTKVPNSPKEGALANGGVAPTFKKKRSQVVHISELLKRKYRRRPLTKVLEHTTMVPVRIICDESANPFERFEAISPTYECDNSNRVKDSELLKRELPEVDGSHTLFNVPFVDDDLQSSGIAQVREPSSPVKPCVGLFKGKSSRDLHIQASSVEHEALDEPDLMCCAARINQKVEKGASKWQLKGKRKTRYLSKNDGSMNSQKKLDVGHEKSDDYGIGLENISQSSPNSNGLVNGFTDLRKHISISASSPRSFSYHQPRFLVHSNSDLPDVPSLYEVEVTVEATRAQAKHVPYISLMSKLSGKPITGHPVAVRTLEDGFCDLQTMDYLASGSCEVDEGLEKDLIVEPKKRKINKHIKLSPRFSGCKGKSSKSKKRHGSSSKKTRKLSSLTGPHKLNPEKRKPMVQSSKGPTLACVPLKIVFSRINEALNGSTRSAHRAMPLDNT